MARKLNSNRTFKITSRFYVIYGDDKPIYVGYTNRTVKQRFKEHKEDKDFSDFFEVKSVELKGEKLSFDFTWDYKETCENADLVSKRECQLVNKYHTQDSVFQKADGGGQTWASEKWFVKSNKDNPKFKDMPASEIKKYLATQKIQEGWLVHFVVDMKTVQESWLNNFVGIMKPVQEVWLGSFIGNMKPVQEVWLCVFVGNMKQVQEFWLGSFVSSMKPVQEVWLHCFVISMNPVQEIWLDSFVDAIKPVQEVWLHNFVNDMRPKGN